MVLRLRVDLGLGYWGPGESWDVYVYKRQKYKHVCQCVFVCDGCDPAGADLMAWVRGKVEF